VESALGRGQARHLATDLLAAFREVGFNPSLSKVAALRGGTPVTVRLDDLDRICQALHCTVADLLEAEPLTDQQDGEHAPQAAAAGAEPGPVRPLPRTDERRRRRPPN
jgi:DNA-binding Xre family transcriptional regulator